MKFPRVAVEWDYRYNGVREKNGTGGCASS